MIFTIDIDYLQVVGRVAMIDRIVAHETSEIESFRIAGGDRFVHEREMIDIIADCFDKLVLE